MEKNASDEVATSSEWETICALADVTPNAGICALFEGQQVAIFHSAITGGVYAIDNYDPIGEANVLSRGIMGSIGDELVVASPLYKQHYSLLTGHCLEEETAQVKVYKVRVQQDQIQLAR